MRSAWFSKPGETGLFFRCGSCRNDYAVTSEGIYVRVGNQCLAIVCSGCFQKVCADVSSVVPHSFPDLDSRGELL